MALANAIPAIALAITGKKRSSGRYRFAFGDFRSTGRFRFSDCVKRNPHPEYDHMQQSKRRQEPYDAERYHTGKEELKKLLAINAGRQRPQVIAAARNACRMHFPKVPMRVVAHQAMT